MGKGVEVEDGLDPKRFHGVGGIEGEDCPLVGLSSPFVVVSKAACRSEDRVTESEVDNGHQQYSSCVVPKGGRNGLKHDFDLTAVYSEGAESGTEGGVGGGEDECMFGIGGDGEEKGSGKVKVPIVALLGKAEAQWCPAEDRVIGCQEVGPEVSVCGNVSA